MQGIICKVGQSVVFEEGSEMLKELLGLDVPAKQIQRISEYFGEKFENLVKSNCEAVIPQIPTKMPI